jgi:ribosomal protein S14
MFLKHLNKDKIRRFLTQQFEIKLQVFKALFAYNLNFSSTTSYILNKLYLLNKNCFFSRVNNLCILTGRQSGVYRAIKLSRIKLRDSKYNIYGLRKSS